MFSTGDKIIIALSGGGDSVGLLHVLFQVKDEIGITLEAAHLNHSLRGDESDRDEQFCRELCRQYNVYLSVKTIIPGEIEAGLGSVETNSREKRLKFLEETCILRGADKIVSGHTMDDQAETILQRILRGTGPTGLQGILPVRGQWVRPFLCVTRSEIRDYLTAKNICFRDDSSNNDVAFFRNKIRHQLIPYLRDFFSPNLTNGLVRLSELSRIQEEYLKKQESDAFSDCRIHADSFKILLDKPVFMGYHKVLRQRIVRHCLELLEGEGRDTEMDEIEHILELIHGECGAIDITAGIRCEANSRIAAFIVPVKQYEPIPLKLPGITEIPLDGGIIEATLLSEKVTVDGIMSVLIGPEISDKYGNLTVGVLRRGELMIPSGAKRNRKIRDILSVVSLPGIVKDMLPVVRAGAVSVWIPGFKSSDCLQTATLNNRTEYDKRSLILNFKGGYQFG
ncbi:MAG: tRNA lysidine(34) synthetase TilS [Candidatus Latescibacteria bacterium]|nr:tRNA lysidine(34) synthetase TilS [Candidatus Latescibacterota bacterium]